MPGLSTVNTYSPDEIRGLGTNDFMTMPITVTSGLNLSAGQVMAIDSGTDKGVAYSSGANTAAGILTEDVDASSADTLSSMYVKGNFVESKLTGLDAQAKESLGGKSVGELFII